MQEKRPYPGSLKVRIRKLRESKEYEEAFTQLRKKILTKKNERPPTKENLVSFKIDHISPKTYLFKEPNPYGYVPLEQVQKILKNGNINEHRILIPETYLPFKKRWGMYLLFDPSKEVPKGFDPFFVDQEIPPVLLVHSSPLTDDPAILDLRLNLKYQTEFLLAQIEREIRFYKWANGIKEPKSERYTIDEICQIKVLLKKGLSNRQIFNSLYPEYVNFSPMRDYTIKSREGKKLSDYNAWAAYQRTNRLIKRAKSSEH
jgi:hypothetical protein